jgi:hypothetical protein
MSLTPHTLAADTLLVDAISNDAEALHWLVALNPVFAVLLDPDHRNAACRARLVVPVGRAPGRRSRRRRTASEPE